MPRQFATRVLRALLAVWFVLSVGEPSVVRICPMHASAAAELADSGFDNVSPADHHEHHPHSAAGHHAGHTASGHSHSGKTHQHHCTCINCCVASAALAASSVQLAPAQVVVVVAQTASWRDVPALQDPPHLLPPGTGPPRA